MLFNNYKQPKTYQSIELGTPSYIATIGANVLDAPNDLAMFLTSFIPGVTVAKETNVFQALHESIKQLKENPLQSTPQKIVGTISWLAGMAPGFGLASSAVRTGSGLLGVTARSTLAKSIEGGLSFGVADYPVESVEHPERSALESTGKFAEDVALGVGGEYAIRKLAPAIRDWLGARVAEPTLKKYRPAEPESSVPPQAERPMPPAQEEQPVPPTQKERSVFDTIKGNRLDPTQAAKDSLDYSVLHEAVRHTELSNPNALSDVTTERIIQDLQESPKLDELIAEGKNKYFYQAIKDYKPNSDVGTLDAQLDQLANRKFNKPSPRASTAREEFIKQFHPDNLDPNDPLHAKIKKHIDNKEILDAFIKCRIGL